LACSRPPIQVGFQVVHHIQCLILANVVHLFVKNNIAGTRNSAARQNISLRVKQGTAG